MITELTSYSLYFITIFCEGFKEDKRCQVSHIYLLSHLFAFVSKPGRVAQSVGHLTRRSGVLGSIPGLATYFRFSFRFFQEGQLSVTGESMCTKYWLTA